MYTTACNRLSNTRIGVRSSECNFGVPAMGLEVSQQRRVGRVSPGSPGGRSPRGASTADRDQAFDAPVEDRSDPDFHSHLQQARRTYSCQPQPKDYRRSYGERSGKLRMAVAIIVQG